MTDNRYNLLADGKAKLHAKERRRGWHFCWDYDGLLTTPMRIGACGCFGYGLMKRNRIQKRYEKDYSKMQRRYAPDDWPEWDDGDAVPILYF